jgi:hypothetical protein
VLTSDDQNPASSPAERGNVNDERELDLGIVASGNAEVDESLSVLSDLDQTPVDQHPGVYESVHEQLSDALAKFDDVEVDPGTDVNS